MAAEDPERQVEILRQFQRAALFRVAVADLTGRLPLMKVSETTGGPHRTPSFSVNRPGENNGPRFAGIPMGHEFTSLVLALLQVGGYPPKVEQALLDRIRALDQAIVRRRPVVVAVPQLPAIDDPADAIEHDAATRQAERPVLADLRRRQHEPLRRPHDRVDEHLVLARERRRLGELHVVGDRGRLGAALPVRVLDADLGVVRVHLLHVLGLLPAAGQGARQGADRGGGHGP